MSDEKPKLPAMYQLILDKSIQKLIEHDGCAQVIVTKFDTQHGISFEVEFVKHDPNRFKK